MLSASLPLFLGAVYPLVVQEGGQEGQDLFVHQWIGGVDLLLQLVFVMAKFLLTRKRK